MFEGLKCDIFSLEVMCVCDDASRFRQCQAEDGLVRGSGAVMFRPKVWFSKLEDVGRGILMKYSYDPDIKELSDFLSAVPMGARNAISHIVVI